jgi:5-methylcytosine-specific restriction endonuclease McrA
MSFNINDEVVVFWSENEQWYNGVIIEIHNNNYVLSNDDEEMDVYYDGNNMLLKNHYDFYYYITTRKNQTIKSVIKHNLCNISDLLEINKDISSKKLTLQSRCNKGILVKIPNKNYKRVIKRKISNIEDNLVDFEKKSKRKLIHKTEKMSILRKQDYKCNICNDNVPEKDGIFLFEIDHIIPISQYGTNNESNLHAICPWCHKSKSYQHDRGFIKAIVQNSKNTGKDISREKLLQNLKNRN